MLFTKLKYSPNTVILRLASLRFFYIHVLKRGWSIAETPYPKKVRHLPGVLSQEEVARLLDPPRYQRSAGRASNQQDSIQVRRAFAASARPLEIFSRVRSIKLFAL